MDAITFTVDGCPIPQPRARHTRAGHSYTPDNGIVAYKAAICLLCRIEAKSAGWETAEEQAFAVDLTFVIPRPDGHWKKSGGLTAGAPHFPGKRSGDWDNLAKGVCDAITTSECVWGDDDQVVEATVRKRYAGRREQARTVITIRGLTHGEPP
jgi:Holliday junction resolvase RusA-like endonuclease